MFIDHADIVRALERLRDFTAPRSVSLMTLGGGSDPHAEPFRAGFLSTMDERHEVLRRLQRLDERARLLLLLWHVEGTPVTKIAARLGISRVHCYRVRRTALDAMVDRTADAAGEHDERIAV